LFVGKTGKASRFVPWESRHHGKESDLRDLSLIKRKQQLVTLLYTHRQYERSDLRNAKEVSQEENHSQIEQ